jgi:glutamate dehydrogenase (NAD(P)+)
LLRRYRDIYVPGPDVGTNDADMKTIAVENGIDSVVSKLPCFPGTAKLQAY